MSRIYNAYLEGEDRDFAIMEAESNMIFNKLFAMLEMVDIKLELNKEAAEYKVLQESGTYEDLQFLYTEAEKEAEGEKKGIIQTIIDAIKSVLSSITNGVKNFFSKNKGNPNNMVEVDGEAWDKCQKIDAFWQKLQPAFSNPATAAATIAAAVATIGGLTWGGTKVVKKVKEIDRDAIVQKVSDISNQLKQKLENLVSGFFKSAMKTVWDQLKKIPAFFNQAISKLGVFIGKKEKNPETTPTNTNTNNPAPQEAKPENNGATTTESTDLFDSDLDTFLEKYLSGEIDDSLFEEDGEENVVLTENEIEDLSIGGVSVKDDISVQETTEENIISDNEMDDIRSLFESLDNEELE